MVGSLPPDEVPPMPPRLQRDDDSDEYEMLNDMDPLLAARHPRQPTALAAASPPGRPVLSGADSLLQWGPSAILSPFSFIMH
jgi:hypothetical protein